MEWPYEKLGNTTWAWTKNWTIGLKMDCYHGVNENEAEKEVFYRKFLPLIVGWPNGGWTPGSVIGPSPLLGRFLLISPHVVCHKILLY